MIVPGDTTKKSSKVLLINSDVEIINILEVNLTHINLEIVSVQNGTEALRKIQNDKPDVIILDPELHDMDCNEICQQIIESSKTSHTPIILLSTKPLERKSIVNQEEIAIHYVTKPFNPKEIMTLVQRSLMHKDRILHINLSDGLTNRARINKELARLIRQKEPFAAIYLEMHDFAAINRVYGHVRGNRVKSLLADIVAEATHLFGNSEDIAGHFGRDRFVIITTQRQARTLCRRIITEFKRGIKKLYADAYLQVGHAPRKGSVLPTERYIPITSIHIAVVTNKEYVFHNYNEVTEVASKQIEYLRLSPESNCYFDFKVKGNDLTLALVDRENVNNYKEELIATRSVLTWLDFLARELHNPISTINDCLYLLESVKAKNLNQTQLNNIYTLQENFDYLSKSIEGIINFTRDEAVGAGALFGEVNIEILIRWVLKQVQGMAKTRKIKTTLKIIGEIGPIMGEKKALTESLLYVIRNEIQSSQLKNHLHIIVFENDGEFINIEINNPQHYFPTRKLNSLLQDLPNKTQNKGIYSAKFLVRSLGGALEITSEKEKGTTYKFKIPKKWQSCTDEVDTLRCAMEISRKEAGNTLKNIQHQVSSLVEQVPPTMKDAYDKIIDKIHELGVLCNRSLFLTDDLGIRLTVQQDQLLQQEVDQFATLEAIFTICRDIAHSMNIERIFDRESANRVAKYSILIGNKLMMSRNDLKALHYAALFKDLGLVLSPNEMIKQKIITKIEDANEIKARYNPLWKALLNITCLTKAMGFILYKHEKYNGTGGRFGIKGNNIPLGARVLAIVDYFDTMTSAQSPQSKLTPKLAMQKIVKGSGIYFDPRVVNVFLILQKKKKSNPVTIESL